MMSHMEGGQMNLKQTLRLVGKAVLIVMVAATLVALTYDQQGNVLMVDMDRDRSWYIDHSTFLQTVLVGGNRDSSMQMPTLGARQLWLRAYGTPCSTVFRAVVAIQIRAHRIDLPDTIAAIPWSRNLWSLGSSSDTVGTANLALLYGGSSTQASPDEFLWALPGAPYAGQPRGRWIPLVDRTGHPFTAPFTSIRVRPVAFYDQAGNVLTFSSMRVAMNFDLVGLR